MTRVVVFDVVVTAVVVARVVVVEIVVVAGRFGVGEIDVEVVVTARADVDFSLFL